MVALLQNSFPFQMPHPRSFLKNKVLPFAFSVSVFLVLILLGELLCRLFTDINFLDSSAGLISQNRFSGSYGNTPNFEGVSFGEPVVIDENGFRVDPTRPSDLGSGEAAILILGDSVGFGPGITADGTIDALIRPRLKDRRIYNASVIGYDTFDYKNAGLAIVKDKPEISEVLVLFCLNDISGVSARKIKAQGGQADPSGDTSLIQRANNYLRSRSKLYLYLKDLLRDTQMIYFQNEHAAYQQGQEYVDQAIDPLSELSSELKQNGVSLKVFVSPYEVQLRPGAPAEYLAPQTMLAESFRKKGVDFVDLYPEFQASGRSSKELFLAGDPMHLSRAGNALVAEAICSGDIGC